VSGDHHGQSQSELIKQVAMEPKRRVRDFQLTRLALAISRVIIPVNLRHCLAGTFSITRRDHDFPCRRHRPRCEP